MGPKYNNGLQDGIYLSTLPIQKTPPKSVESEPTRAGISRDLRDDLKRGNNRASDPTGEWVLLHPFSCTKKDGGQRPVINLKNLNSFIHAPHFKMEGIHTLKSLLKKDDWIVKIDLKDAYFSVPISQNHRKFLCFQFNNKSYQFNCLPFGLASAPRVFTKTLKPIAALGRELGIQLVVYIDDILLMAETREKARDHASGLIYLLQCLGFTINSEKTILEPSQRLEFLGFTVDTINMGLSLPTQKIKKIWAESRQLLEAELVTCRALSRLIGKMNATNQVIPPAPFFYRSLQIDLASALRKGNQDYETYLVLSPDSREELIWWDTQMINWNGRTVLTIEPDLTIESDASTSGGGTLFKLGGLNHD